MNQTGLLVVDLPSPLPPTLFARFGLLIPALMGLVGLGFGLGLGWDSGWRRPAA
jgi:hypothetical protein